MGFLGAVGGRVGMGRCSTLTVLCRQWPVTPGVRVSYNYRQPVAFEHEGEQGTGRILITSQGPRPRRRPLWHRRKPRMAGECEARQ